MTGFASCCWEDATEPEGFSGLGYYCRGNILSDSLNFLKKDLNDLQADLRGEPMFLGLRYEPRVKTSQ